MVTLIEYKHKTKGGCKNSPFYPMNYKDIPTCESLQALTLEELLPDGVYLTKIYSTIRKIIIINGIVSLYGYRADKFINRFGQNHFFAVNKVVSRLNNKKWKQKARILKAGKENDEKYRSQL